jgi:hypothetical protein
MAILVVFNDGLVSLCGTPTRAIAAFLAVPSIVVAFPKFPTWVFDPTVIAIVVVGGSLHKRGLFRQLRRTSTVAAVPVQVNGALSAAETVDT